MTNNDPMSLPLPAFAGGTKAITLTPVVGEPRREYAEMYVPGEEPLEDGELRVTVLGSGNPWVTRGQAQVIDQLPPIPGKQRVPYTPVLPAPPAWWAEALIPLD
jgi:hypothetical protein